MMNKMLPTFSQLIQEQYSVKIEVFFYKHLDFFKNIKTATNKCKTIIQAMDKKNIALVRGAKGKKGTYFKSKTATKRKPVDTSPEVDEFIEEFRKKNFPRIPSRQSSVFCFPVLGGKKFIGSSYTASRYGMEFVVLPVDGSKYFQSNTIDDLYGADLYIHIRTLISYMSKPTTNTPYNVVKKKRELVDSELNNYFKDYVGDPSQFRANSGEVVIEHKGYYAFERDVWIEWVDLIEDGMFSQESLNVIKEYL